MREQAWRTWGRPSGCLRQTVSNSPTGCPAAPPCCRSWAAAVPSSDIALPQRNDYLPTDFELKGAPVQPTNGTDKQPTADGSAVATDGAAAGADGSPGAFPSPPVLLLDAPGLRVWHKQDEAFGQPRTNAYVRLASAAGYASPRAAALAHLLIKALEDTLCETAYLAEVAGLHYGIWWEGGAGERMRMRVG